MAKEKTPRTRGNGTMTEAMYWAFIRSCLRQKSRYWKPILVAKLAAKQDYEGPNKRQKFEYICNSCKQGFMEKDINVDHIKAAGALNCGDDLKEFVETLFCEVDNLQVLCETCHNIKTQGESKFNRNLKKQKKMMYNIIYTEPRSKVLLSKEVLSASPEKAKSLIKKGKIVKIYQTDND